MVILSAASALDQPIRDYLRATFSLAPGPRSMTDLSTTDLNAIPSPQGHPIGLLLPDLARSADLVAVADDDDEARRRLNSRARAGTARPVSAAELAAAKARAQEIGRAGEALYCSHLESELAASRIDGFLWTADQNATSPFDFQVSQADGSLTLVDVKSTTGPFSSLVHISIGELEVAAAAPDYRIARIFDLEAESGPQLAVSEPICGFAADVLLRLKALPPKVRASKLEVHPNALTWARPQMLQAEED
jgi:hypothetical protein